MGLMNFIVESNKIEGLHACPTLAEEEAYKKFLNSAFTDVQDLEEFVSAVEPGAVLRRREGQNVYVGNHVPPQGGHDVEVQLTALLRNIHALGPYQSHIAYENLHPFTDGNGRSGRVLWLKQQGGTAPIGFLHAFYYQTLASKQQ